MACSACKRDLKIVGHRLCSACYQRWRRWGTADPRPKRVKQKCQIPECDDWVVSHGLCDMHRLRLRRHGHTEQTRPDSWGAIEKHPLMHAWRWMKRHRGVEDISPDWQDDFLQFVADVGERPSPKHKLYRADDSRPLGPDNFVWKLSITQKAEGEDLRTYNARLQRVYRHVRKEGYQNTHLKRKFGISKKDYEAMFLAQDGKCAICRRVETAMIRGRKLSLAVDHCHKTGKVRSLLCHLCNRGLGCFKDDPELVKKAAAYLAA